MIRKLYWMLTILATASLLISACASPDSPDGAAPTAEPTPAADLQPSPVADPEASESEPAISESALVIYSGRREPLIAPVIEAFKAHQPEIEVAVKIGDNSALANEVLEEQGNPQADLFITTEMFTVKALEKQGAFEAYISPNATGVPEQFKNLTGSWTGVTLRTRVIMYNTDLVSPYEAPKSIFELTNARWQGQVAAAGSTNGSLQAQVAVLQKLIGDEETKKWLQGLLNNDTTFLGGHTDVRKAVGAGEFKLGLVNHYYYYLQKAEGSPVGIVFPDQGEGQIGTIANVSAVAIVKGGRHPEAAKLFVDFLLSPEGQELFAKLNYEYPVVPGVPLHPDVEPLADYRLADVNLSDDAIDLDQALDLIEEVGLP